jgi:hypothetical protein
VNPEIYIVRIYRRRRGWEIVGRIETPGGARQARFASLEELATILSSPRTRMARWVERKDDDR